LQAAIPWRSSSASAARRYFHRLSGDDRYAVRGGIDSAEDFRFVQCPCWAYNETRPIGYFRSGAFIRFMRVPTSDYGATTWTVTAFDVVVAKS
jgi:hypothetical protein